jgi:UDP-glucose 4-epimerase
VNEIIQSAERVLQRPIPMVSGERRSGASSVLVADARRACEELGWAPQYPQLEQVIGHAAAWERVRDHLPQGTMRTDRTSVATGCKLPGKQH